MFRKAALLILLSFGLAACSQQYREAEADMDEQELFDLYYEISGSVGAFSAVDPNALVQDQRTLLWASKSSSSRPAPSIIALSDPRRFFEFSSLDFVEAAVVFIDGLTEQGTRHFGLFMRVIYPDGQPQYFAGLSEPDSETFTDDEFQVPIPGLSGETIVIFTDDLSEDYSDELHHSVKLEFWVDDGNDIFYAGQASTMAGYGRR